MTDTLLILNAGSSSIKFALYPVAQSDTALLKGQIARIADTPTLSHDRCGEHKLDLPADAGHVACLQAVLDLLKRDFPDFEIRAAGHRVVHGGDMFDAASRITPDTLARIKSLSPLAPLHQPHNIAGIEAVAKTWPEIEQIACFDTGFHQTQPEINRRLPISCDLHEAGIHRFGFHGLSYAYIATQLETHLGEIADERVVVLHLGAGASICAMKNRASVATTMGFTAFGGIMMATRTGDLDPGVLLHLLQQKRYSAEDLERMVSKEGGLLGVSGETGDMRQLQASDNPRAAQAVDLFMDNAAEAVAALGVKLGGVDALVFTGGIGENSAPVRAGITKRLGWIGLSLDDAANETGGPDIGARNSRVRILALRTNEEAMIARLARGFL